MDNDIAVMRTSSAISFNNNARPGSIAGSNYNLGDNQVVWAAGWGTTSVRIIIPVHSLITDILRE